MTGTRTDRSGGLVMASDAGTVRGPRLDRRRLLRRLAFGGSAALLGGCDQLDASDRFQGFLSLAERLNYRLQRALIGQRLVPEFRPDQISATFPMNGSREPAHPEIVPHVANGFADWQLEITGLVAEPARLSLADLRAMPARTQITRHDCVEGWSAIGQWTGVPLGLVLDRVGLDPRARFIVFRCADLLGGRIPYYESIDLVDAYHAQTILAYGMGDDPLPLGHGAPLRLRVERQLGYKHAKFVMQIEAVASLAGIGEGRGGTWEDIGNYAWYAGV